ncbi:hypothetical protein BGZ47_001196 [Haplosporangium gracile]|nr:hypothetical protein BGZ47_001196 [Haplosporangium gracile]
MLLHQLSLQSPVVLLMIDALFSTTPVTASSSTVWSAFKNSVDGNLIATFPAARECHDPYYDKVQCDRIQKGYYDARWRTDEPGILLQTNWRMFHGRGCLGTNQSTPCYRGAVPVYTVKAMSVAHIQETVRFASEHNIRLVIKNTGHDFLSRSTAPSSISLCRVRDGYKAVDTHSRIAIGGGHGSVGAVDSFYLGGGHGPLTSRHGLCADHVLQYTVVTADSEVRIANDYLNQNLFRAQRGGALGFAVVPFLDYARSFPTVGIVNNTVDHYPTFYAMFQARGDAMFGEKAAGVNALLGSRLIPRFMF